LSFLLDTNVVSEAMAASPAAEVVVWIDAQPMGSIHLSVVTVGEIEFGIAQLPDGSKRERLQAWRDELVRLVGRRVLPIDLRVANAWATIRAAAKAAKCTMPPIDALIAATAEVHGLTLATRNVKDFAAWAGPTFNPWVGAEN